MKTKTFSDTAREFYGDHYEEFKAMGPRRMSARARAHVALVDRVQCAPHEPHPDAHADAPTLRHDWLCDAVTEAIEDDRKASDLAEVGARPQAECPNCRGIDLPAMSNDAHGAGQEGAVADVITYLREIGAEEPALAIETGEWRDVVIRAKARETPAPYCNCDLGTSADEWEHRKDCRKYIPAPAPATPCICPCGCARSQLFNCGPCFRGTHMLKPVASATPPAGDPR